MQRKSAEASAALEVRVSLRIQLAALGSVLVSQAVRDRELAWKGLAIPHTQWTASLPNNGETAEASPESCSK